MGDGPVRSKRVKGTDDEDGERREGKTVLTCYRGRRWEGRSTSWTSVRSSDFLRTRSGRVVPKGEE